MFDSKPEGGRGGVRRRVEDQVERHAARSGYERITHTSLPRLFCQDHETAGEGPALAPTKRSAAHFDQTMRAGGTHDRSVHGTLLRVFRKCLPMASLLPGRPPGLRHVLTAALKRDTLLSGESEEARAWLRRIVLRGCPFEPSCMPGPGSHRRWAEIQTAAQRHLQTGEMKHPPKALRDSVGRRLGPPRKRARAFHSLSRVRRQGRLPRSWAGVPWRPASLMAGAFKSLPGATAPCEPQTNPTNRKF